MRNVLVAVAGTTPQVITETLWALVTRPHGSQFIPDELHILTNAAGASLVRTRLLGENGKLAEFCMEYDVPQIKPRLWVPSDSTGRELSDIRDLHDNIAFANTATRVIRDLTRDNSTRIHASLAGGRKTMSFYVGYAMSLFGRPLDVLSHVMVPAEFEGCKDFWWIPNKPRQVHNERDGRSYSTVNARIDLAEIPFVRLHHFIREPIFRDAEIDFASLVASVQSAVNSRRLQINDDERRVKIGDLSFQLPHREYAMYRTLAEVARNRWPGAGPDGLGPEHHGWLTVRDFELRDSSGTVSFLKFYDAAFRGATGRVDALTEEIGKIGDPKTGDAEEMQKKFREIRSLLKKRLEEYIPDPALRQRFGEHQLGRSPRRFGLLLDPSEIEVESNF